MALTTRGWGTSPWDTSFDTFRSSFDRLFEDLTQDVMGEGFGEPEWGAGTVPIRGPGRGRQGLGRRRRVGRLLNMDIRDMESHYEVRVDVPGVEKDNINLTVDETDKTMTVEAHRPREGEEEGKGEQMKGQFLMRECPFGKLHRVIALPADADVDKAEVHFNNCVLRMMVPKIGGAGAGGKRLQIK